MSICRRKNVFKNSTTGKKKNQSVLKETYLSIFLGLFISTTVCVISLLISTFLFLCIQHSFLFISICQCLFHIYQSLFSIIGHHLWLMLLFHVTSQCLLSWFCLLFKLQLSKFFFAWMITMKTPFWSTHFPFTIVLPMWPWQRFKRTSGTQKFKFY